MFLLEEKHGYVALRVSRGLTGLNTWVSNPLFPGDFSLAEKCKYMAGMWERKTKTKRALLHMYLKQLEKMRINFQCDSE
jgi:hypothetical protein